MVGSFKMAQMLLAIEMLFAIKLFIGGEIETDHGGNI